MKKPLKTERFFSWRATNGASGEAMIAQ